MDGGPILIDDYRGDYVPEFYFEVLDRRIGSGIRTEAVWRVGEPRGRYGADWVAARPSAHISGAWTSIPFADPGTAFRYGMDDRRVWAFRCGGGWSLGRFVCTDEEIGKCSLVQIFKQSPGGRGLAVHFLHPLHDRDYGVYGADYGLVLSPKNVPSERFCYSGCEAYVRHPAFPLEWMGLRRGSGENEGLWVAWSYPLEVAVPEPEQSLIGIPAHFGSVWVSQWQAGSSF
jgi:hypothetical protein